MIRIMWFIVFAALAIFLGIQLSISPGYVLIATQRWTLETSIWVALLCLIVAIWISCKWIFLIAWFSKLPNAYKQSSEKRRHRKARITTQQGLIKFSEGQWLEAKKDLIAALPNSESPLLNYLTAARAAQEIGNFALRDDYLSAAQQTVPAAKTAVAITQAQLQLANQQWEQALITLQQLQESTPNHSYVLKLLLMLYEQIHDWSKLIELLPSLKRYNMLSKDEWLSLQKRVYIQSLIEFVKLDKVDELANWLSDLPNNLKNEPEIIYQLALFELHHNNHHQAELVLRRCLKKNFHAQLIQLYGTLAKEIAKLDWAESLLQTTPNSADLYLCLGQLCEKNQLWGKAKNYLEKSIDLGGPIGAYLQLGQLYESLDDAEQACVIYRQGLLKASTTNHSIENS